MLRNKAKNSLQWLIRSIEATGNKGSSHIFARWRYPLGGWHLGYPETTGYIIETLIKYHPIFPELDLRDHAMQSAKWLVTQQLPNGSFPALLSGNQTPSFFNSGMIALGLLEVLKQEKQESIMVSLKRLVAWLHQLDWGKTIYNGPSYYTRAMWAYYLLAQTLSDQLLKKKIEQQMDNMKNRITTEMSVKSWGFESKDQAFTHTIAYTWRGFYEYGQVTGKKEFLDQSTAFCKKLLSLYQTHNKLAGSYNTEWCGDYSFLCLTGHAQLSYLAQEIGWQTQNQPILQLGRALMEDILDHQSTGRVDPELKGAVAGSYPIWGKYMRFKHPNWAVKFYLDALYTYWHKNI